ncbi:hypothetical protein LCGC14_0581180 [marine sediment metagenome]|uniref:Uncharacterized protein n=1 Tax=marine sediment metagenome TaxID=412755 RepID=A0A0F9RGB7_9ZZZZ|nr:MAG: hypothetical protein Lokiarch_52600 [Candidatus Lokiarchaeum sp. GC14_75]HEC38381.1 hypothetical protein [bacterium]
MPYVLGSIKIYQVADDILNDVLKGLENWCSAFNEFFIVFSKYLKYIFVFIILSIGFLTLMRLRGVFQQSRLKGLEIKEDSFTKIRLVLGCLYIFLGFGILFNYLTYFLIWILKPLPDRLIYNFISLDPLYMNGIMGVSVSQYPHEKTIYFGISFGSLMSVLDIIISLWYLINSNRLIHNPKSVFVTLIAGIMGGILFGFTTFFPFFL